MPRLDGEASDHSKIGRQPLRFASGSLPTPGGANCDHLGEVGGLITIGTYGTRDEAEVVQGLLASGGIEALIRADDAGGAFPFVLSGTAQVLVDESDAAAASELLANSADET
jgi:Putative prokaryotic signal transducing protein